MSTYEQKQAARRERLERAAESDGQEGLLMLTNKDRRFLDALAGAIDRICDDANTSIIAASTSRIRTILARPATVAELYEQVDSKHAVEWVAPTGERMRIRRQVGSPVPRDLVEYYSTMACQWRDGVLGPADMSQAARLVEISDAHRP